MANLTRASKELYQRQPDERFASLNNLTQYCRKQKEQSIDRWQPLTQLAVVPIEQSLNITAGSDGAFTFNEWSFSQLCSLARVNKDTIARLSPDTASRVFAETLRPTSNKPLQLLTSSSQLRSIHGASYTRLWNLELVNVLQEFAVDFQPPQAGGNGATGLYAGEQDMFAFMIDPTGWAEIDGQSFAPGFFVWNSEVGKRSLGISTFWFQAVCRNHIVWDAVEFVEVSRKHTASVHEALVDVRRAIEQLVAKRDARKDGFVRVVRKAMQEKLGDDAEDVMKVLAANGITKPLAKRALESAKVHGAFTIFALVDALTRMAQEEQNAGDRLAADESAAKLLAFAT